MKFIQTFTVIGSHQFPIDMLRYDGCFPTSESDSEVISRGCSTGDPGAWSVNLTRYISQKNELPTIGRWASFLAEVKPDSIVTRKS